MHFGSKEVEDAFGVIADAFLFFDEDGDGYLTKDEIEHALSKGHGLENAGGDVIRQRFGEEERVVHSSATSSSRGITHWFVRDLLCDHLLLHGTFAIAYAYSSCAHVL